LELGADRDLKDDENKSGVDYANESPRLKRLFYPEEVLRQELELVKAVRLNKFADVKKLLSNGVDPNFILDVERTPSEVEAHFVGETPLTLAVVANLPNIIRTLLAPGSATEVNLANTRGERALKLARDRTLTQIEKMLLQRGALE
jgi:ankyrin repeat protein